MNLEVFSQTKYNW